MHPFPRHGLARAGALALALLLGGCGSPAPETPTAPRATLPAALAPVYARTCAVCHANPASGAPLAGDFKAWAPRAAQGRAVLVDHAINGYRSMPPLGTCMACSREDFDALVAWMAGLPEASR